MKALLLAAGLGTRLYPVTKDMPKCLVPIDGKPLLWYWLTLLKKAGVDEIIINTHHFAGQVEDFIKNQKVFDNAVCVYEKELLLTGGTILKNSPRFGNEPFIAAHADNLSVCSYADFIQAHRNRPTGTDMTMMTFITETPESCGIVECDSEGRVLKFHEKVQNPPSSHANGAVYILEPIVVDYIASLGREKVDFSTEVIPAFMGRIATFNNNVYHRDIGTPESLEIARKDIKQLGEYL
ncbi:nucleotidyltransferase family protein [Seleniivibrio sp.]|uniref:nucleotidyltransferase family protein n=1 Tax=Seleniivibrio sp. TaxID=2898801 RepID=UPI0025F6D300|nr:nucleotidyltransferase family protein [Seleniivibrio sp.]MCD8554277.1 nucleotidyltransferase family protein [Seleniivibrio sp.]